MPFFICLIFLVVRYNIKYVTVAIKQSTISVSHLKSNWREILLSSDFFCNKWIFLYLECQSCLPDVSYLFWISNIKVSFEKLAVTIFNRLIMRALWICLVALVRNSDVWKLKFSSKFEDVLCFWCMIYIKLTYIVLIIYMYTSICVFLLENHWTHFDDILCGSYAFGGYPTLLVCNFLQLVIQAWLVLELVRWEQH